MDYEKAYKDALERAKDVHTYYCDDNAQLRKIETIFPELKESEDEKVRKELMEQVVYIVPDKNETDNEGNVLPSYQKRIDKYIAWLEKQGEMKYTQIDINDAYLKGVTDTKRELKKQDEQKYADNRLIPREGEYYVCINDYNSSDGKTTNTKGKVYKSPCYGYINDDRGFGLLWSNSCTEVYFSPLKDEDWIICENDNVIGEPIQYKTFKNNKVLQKVMERLEDNGFVAKFRLWTIQDAKDGDVLVFKNNIGGIIICKSPTYYDTRSYCRLIGDDFINKEESGWDSKLLIPATKEQCDLLFQKMKEDGYEWDAENKELKKIKYPRMICFPTL